MQSQQIQLSLSTLTTVTNGGEEGNCNILPFSDSSSPHTLSSPDLPPVYYCEKHPTERVTFVCAINDWHFEPLCTICTPEHTQNHPKRLKVNLEGFDNLHKKIESQKPIVCEKYSNMLKRVQQVIEQAAAKQKRQEILLYNAYNEYNEYNGKQNLISLPDQKSNLIANPLLKDLLAIEQSLQQTISDYFKALYNQIVQSSQQYQQQTLSSIKQLRSNLSKELAYISNYLNIQSNPKHQNIHQHLNVLNNYNMAKQHSNNNNNNNVNLHLQLHESLSLSSSQMVNTVNNQDTNKSPSTSPTLVPSYQTWPHYQQYAKKLYFSSKTSTYLEQCQQLMQQHQDQQKQFINQCTLLNRKHLLTSIEINKDKDKGKGKGNGKGDAISVISPNNKLLLSLANILNTEIKVNIPNIPDGVGLWQKQTKTNNIKTNNNYNNNYNKIEANVNGGIVNNPKKITTVNNNTQKQKPKTSKMPNGKCTNPTTTTNVNTTTNMMSNNTTMTKKQKPTLIVPVPKQRSKICKNCNQQMQYLTQNKKHLICRYCNLKERNYVKKGV